MKGFDLFRLVTITFIVGVLTGLGAAGLTFLLHGIEYLVYGQHEGHVPVVITGVEWWQRALGVVIAGFIAGPGWWALRRWGRPIKPVEDGMRGERLPVVETLANVILQMATVAAGASMGRENAPREAGAMVASQLAARLGMDKETTRVLVAAAAGAGLGAMLQIPLAGAIFALEILLGSVTMQTVMVVLACSGVATATTGLLVGHGRFYHPDVLHLGVQTLIAAIILGVLCGALGVAFRQWIAWAERHAPAEGVLWQLPLAFIGVGVLSIWVPRILGNGRNSATLVLESNPALWVVAILIVAKFTAIVMTLRSGAVGGALTPGFSLGAMCGYVLGAGIVWILPGLTPTDFALLGAAAFMSTSMAAPLFALVVVIEFTGQPSEAYLPLFLAAATAAGTAVAIRILLNVGWGRLTGLRVLQ